MMTAASGLQSLCVSPIRWQKRSAKATRTTSVRCCVRACSWSVLHTRRHGISCRGILTCKLLACAKLQACVRNSAKECKDCEHTCAQNFEDIDDVLEEYCDDCFAVTTTTTTTTPPAIDTCERSGCLGLQLAHAPRGSSCRPCQVLFRVLQE